MGESNMGFLNLFKNVGRAASAEAQKKADAIEDANAVEFGKQDLAQMNSDLRMIKGNIGSVKGEIAILEDKVKDLRSAVTKHDADALALSEAGQNELAEQHANKAASIEQQISSLEIALNTQKQVLEGQIKNKNELQMSLDQAGADLVTIKAMTDAAKANETLAKVSTSSGTSALASFKERQEAAKKRLIKSQALKEEGSADSSLDAATAAALGNSTAKNRLAQLKAKANKTE
jgi:phage shock protein A